MCLLFCLCYVIRGLIRWLCGPSSHNNKLRNFVHCHFPLRNLQLQTWGLIYKFLEEMCGHWKCWQHLDGLRIFHSNNVGEPIEYWRCFDSEKFVIVLFVTKQYQPFCKDRRWWGHALIKLSCSGLLPSIKVGPCYLRKWRRGEPFLFYFKTSTVDVDECIQPKQHWSKQHSKVVTPQERLLSIIQFLFRRLNHLPMKQQTFKAFYYLPLRPTCFTTFFLF